MYVEAMRTFMQEASRRLESYVFNYREPAWPGMSRAEWWDYWRLMTEACDTCRDSPLDGGPSPAWAHARHAEEMGFRPH